MKDKRFLKVKKVGEERYFSDKAELIRFAEKQMGMTIERLFNLKLTDESILLKTDFNNERVAFGGFIWKITKGIFGKYRINIIAEQSTSDLSLNEQLSIIN
ncbi:MAG: hypothetical protein L3J56_00970 [Bacteroidales bacterium]|nr:hypothetical protein [Bacteroidales bacterium]